MMNVYRSFLIACFCVSLLGAVGCALIEPSIESQLEVYQHDDNPKTLSRFLFRESRFRDAELESLLTWSLENRWQFLKLVDHLRKDSKKEFLTEFPRVLAESSSREQFFERFEDSPSRSIKLILRAARDYRTGKQSTGSRVGSRIGQNQNTDTNSHGNPGAGHKS